MRTMGWIGGLALGLAGCSSGDNMRGMERDVASLDAHVEEIRTETEAHEVAVAAASDLDAVMGEETHHNGVLESHAGLMNDTLEHMGTCNDGMGNPPDTAPMLDGMEQMREERVEHMALMGSSGNMSDAMGEEEDHQLAMDAMLDAMGTMQGGMMDGAGGYSCSEEMM